jgi:hypothetical protein
MKKSILSINYDMKTVYIDLQMTDVPENTKDLPQTLNVLEAKLPSIFTNQCFNGDGKSFYDEARETETAHLFEHIILENMCLEKIKHQKSAVFNGRTFWDKVANNKCYQIRLNVPLVDWPIFASAFTKSLNLVNQITKHCPTN